MNNLTHQELCTVLAALRVFQQERAARGGPITAIRGTAEPYFHSCADRIDRMEHFEDGTAPLSDKQIDALCERLNCEVL